MTKIYLGLVISLLSKTICAQDVSFEWAKSIGGTGYDVVWSITKDNSNNTYITGGFSGSVDFNPGDNVFELTSNDFSDVFILKLGPEGDFIWVKSLGGLDNDSETSIMTDGSGNIYLTGGYRYTVDFDPGDNVFELTAKGINNDAFILKLNPNGDFVWVKSVGGSMSYESVNSIIIDNFDNIYIAGEYNGTGDFDPGDNVFELTANASIDNFILKLDSNGDFVWVKSFGGTEYDVINSITQDNSNNIYVTGSFEETVDFDPSDNVFELTANGQSDAFILKLDLGGNFVWAKSFGGTGYDVARSITQDNSNNIYVTGGFGGSVDFDPGDNVFELTAKGSLDVFILKLDLGGNFVWAKSIGGFDIEYVTSIITDDSDNICLTGYYESNVDFDPSDNVFELTVEGIRDIFILKLNSDGNFVWAKSIGGLGYDYGGSIIIDYAHNIYVTGSFQGMVDIDPTDEINQLTSNGNEDVFILKLKDLTSDIKENSLFSEVSIHPNPANGLLNIDLANLKNVSIQILDINTRLIYHKENVEGKIHQLNLDVDPGVYFIECVLKDQKQTFKLVIN